MSKTPSSSPHFDLRPRGLRLWATSSCLSSRSYYSPLPPSGGSGNSCSSSELLYHRHPGGPASCRVTDGDLNTPARLHGLLNTYRGSGPSVLGGEVRRTEGDGTAAGVSRRRDSSGGPRRVLSTVLVLTLLTASTCSGAVANELHTGSGLKGEPQFGETIQNVTVAAGREARLSCIVDNLGDFRVGWLKVDSQTILSLQKRVVTHNTRISVTHDEHRTWNLHIRQVKESDSGCYMCQINTPIMKNQIGCIKVHVPPDIIYDKTSSDTTINEGDTVHLRCVAAGYPTPEIKWKREDGRGIVIRSSGREGSKNMDSVPGGNLTLENVSRKQMGAYLCIASNKVPPSVSKRIIVNVNFSPVVKADNQLIGSPLGKDVEIQCHVEAFPRAVNYWERDNGEMLLNGRKYQLEEVADSYRVIMKLTIRSFLKGDAGQYKCISTNSLGRADTSIRLYEIEVATVRATTEHQYHHLYPTTPHSKSVNSLDLHRREGGHNRQLEGVAGTGGGAEGATAGLGVDFDRDQGRQRQRQRQEAGEGRSEGGGYLGGKYGSQGDSHGSHGGSSSRTEPPGYWFSCWSYLLPVLETLRFLFVREGRWVL